MSSFYMPFLPTQHLLLIFFGETFVFTFDYLFLAPGMVMWYRLGQWMNLILLPIMSGSVVDICLNPRLSETVTLLAVTLLGLLEKSPFLLDLKLVVCTTLIVQWLRVTLPTPQEGLPENEAHAEESQVCVRDPEPLWPCMSSRICTSPSDEVRTILDFPMTWANIFFLWLNLNCFLPLIIFRDLCHPRMYGHPQFLEGETETHSDISKVKQPNRGENVELLRASGVGARWRPAYLSLRPSSLTI